MGQNNVKYDSVQSEDAEERYLKINDIVNRCLDLTDKQIGFLVSSDGRAVLQLLRLTREAIHKFEEIDGVNYYIASKEQFKKHTITLFTCYFKTTIVGDFVHIRATKRDRILVPSKNWIDQ